MAAEERVAAESCGRGGSFKIMPRRIMGRGIRFDQKPTIAIKTELQSPEAFSARKKASGQTIRRRLSGF
jgi:hypothetical protein